MMWVKVSPKNSNATSRTGNHRCVCCNDRYAINGEFLLSNFNTEIFGDSIKNNVYHKETNIASSRVLDDFIRNISTEHYSHGLCVSCLDIFFKNIGKYQSLVDLFKSYFTDYLHSSSISYHINKFQQSEDYMDLSGFKMLARDVYSSMVLNIRERDLMRESIDSILDSDIFSMEISLAMLDITCSNIVHSQNGFELSYVKKTLRVSESKFTSIRAMSGVSPKRIGVKHYYSKEDIEKMISNKGK